MFQINSLYLFICVICVRFASLFSLVLYFCDLCDAGITIRPRSVVVQGKIHFPVCNRAHTHTHIFQRNMYSSAFSLTHAAIFATNITTTMLLLPYFRKINNILLIYSHHMVRKSSAAQKNATSAAVSLLLSCIQFAMSLQLLSQKKKIRKYNTNWMRE